MIEHLVHELEEVVQAKRHARFLGLANLFSGGERKFNCGQCRACKICKTDDEAAICESDMCQSKCPVCESEKLCSGLTDNGCDACMNDNTCFWNLLDGKCVFAETADTSVPFDAYTMSSADCPAESLSP